MSDRNTNNSLKLRLHKGLQFPSVFRSCNKHKGFLYPIPEIRVTPQSPLLWTLQKYRDNPWCFRQASASPKKFPRSLICSEKQKKQSVAIIFVSVYFIASRLARKTIIYRPTFSKRLRIKRECPSYSTGNCLTVAMTV